MILSDSKTLMMKQNPIKQLANVMDSLFGSARQTHAMSQNTAIVLFYKSICITYILHFVVLLYCFVLSIVHLTMDHTTVAMQHCINTIIYCIFLLTNGLNNVTKYIQPLF